MRPYSFILAVAAILTIAHHDDWWASDPTLILGVMPISLAWHTGFSIACALAFWGVTQVAWPGDPLQDDTP